MVALQVIGLDSSNAQTADLVNSIRNDLIQLLRKNIFSEEAQYSSPIPIVRAATLTDVTIAATLLVV